MAAHQVHAARVYGPQPARAPIPGCWLTGCGRVASAKPPHHLANGSATSRPPPSCASGTATIPSSSVSSPAVQQELRRCPGCCVCPAPGPAQRAGPGPADRGEGPGPQPRRGSGHPAARPCGLHLGLSAAGPPPFLPVTGMRPPWTLPIPSLGVPCTRPSTRAAPRPAGHHHGDQRRGRHFAEYEARGNRMAHLLRDRACARRPHRLLHGEQPPHARGRGRAPSGPGCTTRCINSYLAPERGGLHRQRLARPGWCSRRRPSGTWPQPPRPLCPGVERWLMVDPDAADRTWESLTRPRRRPTPPSPVADEQLGAAMLYSSGTTGRPKGILRPLPEAAARGTAAGDGVRARAVRRSGQGMTYLSPAPLYHSAPQASVAGALRLGATTVVMEHFDAEQCLEPGRAVPGHALPDGADHVLPAAEAARGDPGRGTTCRRWSASSTPPRRARSRSRRR